MRPNTLPYLLPFAAVFFVQAFLTWIAGPNVDAVPAMVPSAWSYWTYMVCSVPVFWIVPDSAVTYHFNICLVVNSALWAVLVTFAFSRFIARAMTFARTVHDEGVPSGTPRT